MFHYQVLGCLLTGVGCKVLAKPMQSRSPVASSDAKCMQKRCNPVHSAGIDANTVQTECKDDAVGLLFGSASRTPSYLGG
jgi:hypothetical protein